MSADEFNKLRNEFYSFRSIVNDDYVNIGLRVSKLVDKINWEAERETINNNAIYKKISDVRTELWNRETANNTEMWNAITSVGQRIDHESNRETANNNEIWNAISSLGGRIDFEHDRESANNTAIYSHIAAVKKELWDRETVNNGAVWDQLTKLGRSIEFEHDRESANNTAMYDHVAGVKKELWDRETVNNGAVWDQLTKLGRSIEFEHDRETVNNTAFWEAINQNKKDIEFENTRETVNNEAFWKAINANKGDISVLKAFESAQGVWNLNQSKRIGDLESADVEIRGSIKNEATYREEGDKAILEALNKESDERKAVDASIALKLLTIDQAISDLHTRIDNLNFSDLGIIAAITLAAKMNNDLWNAENYDGGSVNENDGKAVRLFKNQFQGLKSHFAGIMKYYFDMNDKDSTIYKLRYSIVAGFEETKDLLTEWFTHLLESSNTTNTHLNSVNTWLELQDDHFKKSYEVLVIITKWLEQIYQKPPPIVNVTIPPIDLSETGNDWLKTLIETIGEVMKTAIETLGKVLETAIGEVGQLLRDLLKFLDGLIDDLIRLVVPENFDFLDKDFGKLKGKFDVKFGDILNIGGKIKDTFTPNKKDFFKAISFTFMGAKFEPNSSATDIYVPMFRLASQVLIWLYVAWFAYEKATGKGDLINDN